MKKALILIFCILLGSTIWSQTPEQKQFLDSAQKEYLQIRALTIQGLKEARNWELLHLKFRQAHRTNIDIKRAKHI